MTRKLIALSVFVLALGVARVEAASFCWDNTDKLIVKLQKLDLKTDQLKDVFQYQAKHRDLIVSSHKDGRGCRFHEHAEVDFEKASIGVLTDEQFQKLSGRDRNETEGLRYSNYLLNKEIARMQLQLAELRAQLAALRAEG